MARPVGLDINGWHDFGCRDWTAEEPDVRLDAPIVLDGGVKSVVVTEGDIREAGPQAILSPIGRGGGWGEIGAPDKRRAVSDHLAALLAGAAADTFDGDMLAAVRAMSRHADSRIICIPDHAGMTDARQDGLLKALAGRREPRALLLWRSVALVLGLLDHGGLPDAAEGMRILCLLHGPQGIERQTLVLRALADHPGVLTPERGGPGDVCGPDLGLAGLLELAGEAVERFNPGLREIQADAPRAAATLLFDAAPLPCEEIVRRSNANWLKLRIPADFALPDLAPAMAEAVTPADKIIFLSPLAERHLHRLRHGLAGVCEGSAVIAPAPDTAALGALAAARRIARDIPHYLDRLDQISMIVLRGREPVFEDLIPANATVPGNREYVSKPITSMVWGADLTDVQFFIRKGGSEIRTARVRVETAPARNEQLEIRLRQMPAQGTARITVSATNWPALRSAPIVLDWSSLEVERRSEAEIIASLQMPRPAVPQRVCYDAHIGLWDGSLRKPGLATLLWQFTPDRPDVLASLVTAVRSSSSPNPRHPLDRLGPVYAVSTDGHLPAGLDPRTRERFFAVVDQVSDLLFGVNGCAGVPLKNNHALLFLTWIFAACPERVRNAVVEAFFAGLRGGRSHRILTPPASKIVVVHGLGRVVADAEGVSKVLPRLCSLLPRKDVIPALSSILSRLVSAPEILARQDIAELGRNLTEMLRYQRVNGSFGRDFKYTLLLVGGMLRVREIDPWALVASDSSVARPIGEELQASLKSLIAAKEIVPAAEKKIELINSIIKYINTNKGRADLLISIDEIDEAEN